jgi:hypothetical protein
VDGQVGAPKPVTTDAALANNVEGVWTTFSSTTPTVTSA